MTAKSEDDFWNTSTSAGFNFDDEEDVSQPFNEFVFNSVAEETSFLPIVSIISKNSLDLILDDIKSVNEYVVSPVEETIKKMLHGQKYSLEVYKKFDEKLLLLDSGLQTMDGNIILKVIFFLKTTLKANIFFHNLSKRKVAVKHYANYLMVHNQLQELANLYMGAENNANMKQIYYLAGRDITNKDIMYKRLEQFTVEHMPKLSNNEEKQELVENMQLIQWQINKNQSANSVIDQLAATCKHEWERNKNCNDAVMEFKKRFRIDDFAFEWTMMNVMASMMLWPQLASSFIKPNWLTKKNVLKTVMRPEIFIYGLSRHQPPKDVLEQYLNCISDSEKSLYLGEKFKCHKFVVQHYINQRDRSSLVNYKGKISPQSEEYLIADNALQSTVKWKN